LFWLVKVQGSPPLTFSLRGRCHFCLGPTNRRDRRLEVLAQHTWVPRQRCTGARRYHSPVQPEDHPGPGRARPRGCLLCTHTLPARVGP
jgi:hypothetical protein